MDKQGKVYRGFAKPNLVVRFRSRHKKSTPQSAQVRLQNSLSRKEQEKLTTEAQRSQSFKKVKSRRPE